MTEPEHDLAQELVTLGWDAGNVQQS
jgi:hypothetical protein